MDILGGHSKIAFLVDTMDPLEPQFFEVPSITPYSSTDFSSGPRIIISETSRKH
jgi:hypothetical protein